MAESAAHPGRRLRVTMPRGGGRLMRKEAAVRLLLDLARQMRFRLTVDGGPGAGDSAEGAEIRIPRKR
jgi:hypothetical protein